MRLIGPRRNVDLWCVAGEPNITQDRRKLRKSWGEGGVGPFEGECFAYIMSKNQIGEIAFFKRPCNFVAHQNWISFSRKWPQRPKYSRLFNRRHCLKLEIQNKVHIFWEGHKYLRNLHRIFVLCSNSQIYSGYFAKFYGFSEYINFK